MSLAESDQATDAAPGRFGTASAHPALIAAAKRAGDPRTAEEWTRTLQKSEKAVVSP